MRRLLRWLGSIAILAALAVLLVDLFAWFDGQPLTMTALGRLWARLDRDSLLLLQPAIERHLAPWLWSEVLFPLLQAPAAAVLGALGLGLLWLGRRR